MQRTELEERMAARVRRHVLITFGALGVGLVVMVGAGAGARALFGSAQPAWARLVPAFGILLIAAAGIFSTFKYLRCPSCDRLVATQVSRNYSLFRRGSNTSCDGCGQKIFADTPTDGQRARRFKVLFVIGMLVGVASLILGATHRH